MRTLLQEILSNFDLGELLSYERDRRGTVNTSFTIETDRLSEKRKYFLRQYKQGIKEQELQFEHSLINHLAGKGYPPIACVHPALGGSTYLIKPGGHAEEEPLYYAVFDFLSGEDRYTWVNPICTDLEVERSAQILAQFHSAVIDFSPQGRRVEPCILELLPIIQGTATNAARQSKNTSFDHYLAENLPFIQAEAKHVIEILSQMPATNMPQIVIHCDYHPGNLKFEGEDIVGLFDFDWSKVDYRCFDVGLAAFYFMVSWEAKTNGHLRLEQFARFIAAYQQECIRLKRIQPLSSGEFQFLPEMIRAGNLYVMNWAILDYYAKELDPLEYSQYLLHSIETIRWFSDASNYELVQRVISPHILAP